MSCMSLFNGDCFLSMFVDYLFYEFYSRIFGACLIVYLEDVVALFLDDIHEFLSYILSFVFLMDVGVFWMFNGLLEL